MFKVILNTSKNNCAAKKLKSVMKKEQRIISYLYLNVRSESKKINKYLITEYFLFISMTKKGEEVSLRRTFSHTPAIPAHRTSDKTGRDRRQVAAT